MTDVIAALDLWTLFVTYVFGSFWIAVIGIAGILFVISGVLGRVSINSVSWFVFSFILAMTLGYGYLTITMVMSAIIIIVFVLSIKSYFDNR